MNADTYDRFRLEELVTRREAMISANQERCTKNQAQAYDEDTFNALADEIRNYAETR
jgi:hypothetical protein